MKFVRSLNACSSDELIEIEIALGEGIANAVEHGATTADSFFEVRCTFTGAEIIAEVADRGPGFDEAMVHRNTPPSDRGHGISVIRAVADEVTYLDGGRVLRFVKRVASPKITRTLPRSDQP